MLAYPFAFDQYDNAQRAVEWGAALRIDVKQVDNRCSLSRNEEIILKFVLSYVVVVG